MTYQFFLSDDMHGAPAFRFTDGEQLGYVETFAPLANRLPRVTDRKGFSLPSAEADKVREAFTEWTRAGAGAPTFTDGHDALEWARTAPFATREVMHITRCPLTRASVVLYWCPAGRYLAGSGERLAPFGMWLATLEKDGASHGLYFTEEDVHDAAECYASKAAWAKGLEEERFQRVQEEGRAYRETLLAGGR